MDTPKQPVEAWAFPLADLLAQLTTTEAGLNEQEAEARLATYGRNIFRKRDRKGPLALFFKQLASPLIFILIAAGVITFILNEHVETIVITIAVLVNAGLGFAREYHAENTLERLSTYIKDRSRVIRGSHEFEIDSELLVPGDIIKLSYGMRIPADARLISVTNLRVDEAVLTGESVAIEKHTDIVALDAIVADRKNMVHAGTLVVDGFAVAVVVATGEHTEIGKIAGLVGGISRAATPIQKGLSTLSWIIFGMVLLIVIGIFILGVHEGQPFFDMLVLAAAVSVGAVPEALPIALTVILSIGAERIAKKQGVTRTLAAAETLGSATLILTDKTGTLTMADMRLVGVYTIADLLNGVTPDLQSLSSEGTQLIHQALANVDVLVENPDQPASAWTFKGKPFEVNIVENAREHGIDISRFSEGVSSIILPFNSTNKFSVSDAGGHYTILGAPDILLSRSTVDEHTAPLIETWLAGASMDGQRLIAIATKKKTQKIQSPRDVQGITLHGVLAFHDPIRPEVPDAIAKIEAAGVRVAMVTGDLKGTALSVARSLGWDVDASHVITGADLRVVNDEDLLQLLPRLRIFARVTPEDKLRIGMLYRKLGEVVAMTGDGVNDAPALKAMDIGVALGSGSDVAKSAADLVLLNDDFLTISSAIHEGRRILVNIRKTLVYLMSNSLDEVFVVGGSLVFGLPLPLSALQIIWVNLFTGSLPALSFAYDENFDEAKGKHGSTSIFTPAVKGQIYIIGVLNSVLLFVIYYWLIKTGVSVDIARSIFFVCFASYVSVIAFSFRSLSRPLFTYPLFSNRQLNISLLVSVGLLVVTMAVPFMRELFELAPLPLEWLWFIIGWLIFNVLIVEFAKFVFRKKAY